MEFDKLDKLYDNELFDLQNQISEVIRKRNLEKGDI